MTVRIVTRPPGEGRRHQRGLGRAGGWAPAGAEVSAGTWLGAPLLCGRLGAAVGAVAGGGRALTPGRA